MKNLLFCFFFLTIFLAPKVFAQSNYVLPYPSAMPGSSSYKVHLIIEKIEEYWYFGNLAQFTYNLKISDKYLVEAKTLFEYKQYLLGYKALQKSNFYFQNTKPFLTRAKSEGKDTGEKEKILKNAALKHQEVLQNIKLTVPDVFTWTPEKDHPTKLYLRNSIEESISLRKKI